MIYRSNSKIMWEGYTKFFFLGKERFKVEDMTQYMKKTTIKPFDLFGRESR